MSQIKPEEVKGIVRNTDKTHTAVLSDGSRVKLDAGESSSLLNRLDKDRSRMEREGTRQENQGKERHLSVSEKHQRQEAQRREMMDRQRRR